ncbi:hypothetical protein QR680_010229 [Steinernema hermaphroditum]|uniref:Peptidase M14 domain-containing protein n=1 Tax=Steinernema hermaphroditum TaxID=289476 RepID=A0AA39IN93_9BILA|nr:hypothetical protein QR680_010229 [Steinernema hermaphroditum]
MLFWIVPCVLFRISLTADVPGDGPFRLVRFHPKYKFYHNFIAAIHRENFWNVQFMNLKEYVDGRPSRDENNAIDVLIPPQLYQPLLMFLNESVHFDLEFVEILVEDVERSNLSHYKDIVERLKIRQADDNKRTFQFGYHNSYTSTVSWLHKMQRRYSSISEVFQLGVTHEGRSITGIKIGRRRSAKKAAVWIDGGIHAREWAAPHSVLYYIYMLLSSYGSDAKITEYINGLDFYIVPVLNPDGYEFTQASIENRLWRKNRSPLKCNEEGDCCQGVDLNRNFDIHWNSNSASSSDPCKEIYHGMQSFSEPEARAVRDKIVSPELDGRLSAFITVHSYHQILIYPENTEGREVFMHFDDLKRVGEKAVETMNRLYGGNYTAGTGSDLFGGLGVILPGGASEDWANAKANVKYTYCLELGPDYTFENMIMGFMLPADQLIPTAKESWEGIRVIIDAAYEESKAKM